MTLATIKQDILKQYKNLVSKAILKAIDIIFSPCCDVEVTAVSFDCGTEEFTATLSPAIPSVGLNGGIAYVFAEGALVGNGTISDDGTTITIAGADEGTVVGITSYSAIILLPTGYDDQNNGAYLVATGTVTAISPC